MSVDIGWLHAFWSTVVTGSWCWRDQQDRSAPVWPAGEPRVADHCSASCQPPEDDLTRDQERTRSQLRFNVQLLTPPCVCVCVCLCLRPGGVSYQHHYSSYFTGRHSVCWQFRCYDAGDGVVSSPFSTQHNDVPHFSTQHNDDLTLVHNTMRISL